MIINYDECLLVFKAKGEKLMIIRQGQKLRAVHIKKNGDAIGSKVLGISFPEVVKRAQALGWR